MSKYLFDSNSLITPYKNYYPSDVFPTFWEKLKIFFLQKSFLIDKVYNEIMNGKYDFEDDFIKQWVTTIVKQSNNIIIKTNTTDIMKNYASIMQYVKECDDYTNASFNQWASSNKADPFLIATAKVENAVIVTEESFVEIITPMKKEPHIPNVAENFEVRCINLVQFLKENNFRL